MVEKKVRPIKIQQEDEGLHARWEFLIKWLYKTKKRNLDSTVLDTFSISARSITAGVMKVTSLIQNVVVKSIIYYFET